MRRGKSNRSCLHTHPPQDVCWNLPYLVVPRCFLEMSQLGGYKVSRKGKMEAQTWQITGFFSLLLRLAALSSEKNKSNVSATCLLSCKLSWWKRGFTNHRQVNKNLIHRKKGSVQNAVQKDIGNYWKMPMLARFQHKTQTPQSILELYPIKD